jgi:hypothetical protein
MIIEENTSVFDLALTIEGSLDNSILNILSKYSLTSFSQDLTGLKIAPVYNTKNKIVNQFLLDDRQFVTSETMLDEFKNISFAEFSTDFSHDFDSY